MLKNVLLMDLVEAPVIKKAHWHVYLNDKYLGIAAADWLTDIQPCDGAILVKCEDGACYWKLPD